MPHFSDDDLGGEDPDVLRRLRRMLRDPGAPRRAGDRDRPPTRAERFGPRAATDAGECGGRDPAPAGQGPRRGAR